MPPQKKSGYDWKDTRRKLTSSNNLDENIIKITESKLENILLKNKNGLEKVNDWKTPASVFVSMILVFLTAEFNKDLIGIPKNTWQSFFMVITVSCFVWLIVEIRGLYKNKENYSISSLIKQIKNEKS